MKLFNDLMIMRNLESLVALKASTTISAAELKTQLQQVSDADCLNYLTKI